MNIDIGKGPFQYLWYEHYYIIIIPSVILQKILNYHFLYQLLCKKFQNIIFLFKNKSSVGIKSDLTLFSYLS